MVAATFVASPGFVVISLALLAVAAEYEPARAAATAMAFGLDLAVLMQVLPGTKAVKVPQPQAPAGGKPGIKP